MTFGLRCVDAVGRFARNISDICKSLTTDAARSRELFFQWCEEFVADETLFAELEVPGWFATNAIGKAEIPTKSLQHQEQLLLSVARHLHTIITSVAGTPEHGVTQCWTVHELLTIVRTVTFLFALCRTPCKALRKFIFDALEEVERRADGELLMEWLFCCVVIQSGPHRHSYLPLKRMCERVTLSRPPAEYATVQHPKDSPDSIVEFVRRLTKAEIRNKFRPTSAGVAPSTPGGVAALVLSTAAPPPSSAERVVLRWILSRVMAFSLLGRSRRIVVIEACGRFYSELGRLGVMLPDLAESLTDELMWLACLMLTILAGDFGKMFDSDPSIGELYNALIRITGSTCPSGVSKGFTWKSHGATRWHIFRAFYNTDVTTGHALNGATAARLSGLRRYPRSLVFTPLLASLGIAGAFAEKAVLDQGITEFLREQASVLIQEFVKCPVNDDTQSQRRFLVVQIMSALGNIMGSMRDSSHAMTSALFLLTQSPQSSATPLLDDLIQLVERKDDDYCALFTLALEQILSAAWDQSPRDFAPHLLERQILARLCSAYWHNILEPYVEAVKSGSSLYTIDGEVCTDGARVFTVSSSGKHLLALIVEWASLHNDVKAFLQVDCTKEVKEVVHHCASIMVYLQILATNDADKNDLVDKVKFSNAIEPNSGVFSRLVDVFVVSVIAPNEFAVLKAWMDGEPPCSTFVQQWHLQVSLFAASTLKNRVDTLVSPLRCVLKKLMKSREPVAMKQLEDDVLRSNVENLPTGYVQAAVEIVREGNTTEIADWFNSQLEHGTLQRMLNSLVSQQTSSAPGSAGLDFDAAEVDAEELIQFFLEHVMAHITRFEQYAQESLADTVLTLCQQAYFSTSDPNRAMRVSNAVLARIFSLIQNAAKATGAGERSALAHGALLLRFLDKVLYLDSIPREEWKQLIRSSMQLLLPKGVEQQAGSPFAQRFCSAVLAIVDNSMTRGNLPSPTIFALRLEQGIATADLCTIVHDSLIGVFGSFASIPEVLAASVIKQYAIMAHGVVGLAQSLACDVAQGSASTIHQKTLVRMQQVLKGAVVSFFDALPLFTVEHYAVCIPLIESVFFKTIAAMNRSEDIDELLRLLATGPEEPTSLTGGALELWKLKTICCICAPLGFQEGTSPDSEQLGRKATSRSIRTVRTLSNTLPEFSGCGALVCTEMILRTLACSGGEVLLCDETIESSSNALAGSMYLASELQHAIESADTPAEALDFDSILDVVIFCATALSADAKVRTSTYFTPGLEPEWHRIATNVAILMVRAIKGLSTINAKEAALRLTPLIFPPPGATSDAIDAIFSLADSIPKQGARSSSLEELVYRRALVLAIPSLAPEGLVDAVRFMLDVLNDDTTSIVMRLAAEECIHQACLEDHDATETISIVLDENTRTNISKALLDPNVDALVGPVAVDASVVFRALVRFGPQLQTFVEEQCLLFAFSADNLTPAAAVATTAEVAKGKSGASKPQAKAVKPKHAPPPTKANASGSKKRGGGEKDDGPAPAQSPSTTKPFLMLSPMSKEQRRYVEVIKTLCVEEMKRCSPPHRPLACALLATEASVSNAPLTEQPAVLAFLSPQRMKKENYLCRNTLSQAAEHFSSSLVLAVLEIVRQTLSEEHAPDISKARDILSAVFEIIPDLKVDPLTVALQQQPDIAARQPWNPLAQLSGVFFDVLNLASAKLLPGTDIASLIPLTNGHDCENCFSFLLYLQFLQTNSPLTVAQRRYKVILGHHLLIDRYGTSNDRDSFVEEHRNHQWDEDSNPDDASVTNSDDQSSEEIEGDAAESSSNQNLYVHATHMFDINSDVDESSSDVSVEETAEEFERHLEKKRETTDEVRALELWRANAPQLIEKLTRVVYVPGCETPRGGAKDAPGFPFNQYPKGALCNAVRCDKHGWPLRYIPVPRDASEVEGILFPFFGANNIKPSELSSSRWVASPSEFVKRVAPYLTLRSATAQRIVYNLFEKASQSDSLLIKTLTSLIRECESRPLVRNFVIRLIFSVLQGRKSLSQVHPAVAATTKPVGALDQQNMRLNDEKVRFMELIIDFLTSATLSVLSQQVLSYLMTIVYSVSDEDPNDEGEEGDEDEEDDGDDEGAQSDEYETSEGDVDVDEVIEETRAPPRRVPPPPKVAGKAAAPKAEAAKGRGANKKRELSANELVTPYHPHTLTWRSQCDVDGYGDGYTCDVCSHSRDSYCFNCKQCGFDVCPVCVFLESDPTDEAYGPDEFADISMDEFQHNDVGACLTPGNRPFDQFRRMVVSNTAVIPKLLKILSQPNCVDGSTEYLIDVLRSYLYCALFPHRPESPFLPAISLKSAFDMLAPTFFHRVGTFLKHRQALIASGAELLQVIKNNHASANSEWTLHDVGVVLYHMDSVHAEAHEGSQLYRLLPLVIALTPDVPHFASIDQHIIQQYWDTLSSHFDTMTSALSFLPKGSPKELFGIVSISAANLNLLSVLGSAYLALREHNAKVARFNELTAEAPESNYLTCRLPHCSEEFISNAAPCMLRSRTSVMVATESDLFLDEISTPVIRELSGGPASFDAPQPSSARAGQSPKGREKGESKKSSVLLKVLDEIKKKFGEMALEGSEGKDNSALEDPWNEQRTEEVDVIVSFAQSYRVALNFLISAKNDPRAALDEGLDYLLNTPKILDFNVRYGAFCSKMEYLQDNADNEYEVLVQRSNLVMSSLTEMGNFFTSIVLSEASAVLSKIEVTFEGEEAMDAGGVKREWITLFFQRLIRTADMANTNPGDSVAASELLESDVKDGFAQMYPISPFVRSGDQTGGALEINAALPVTEHYLELIRHIGMMVGLSISYGIPTDLHLTRNMYSHMIGRQPNFKDLEAVDPELFKNLKYVKDLSTDDEFDALCLTFTAPSAAVQNEEVELMPNGAAVAVTQSNKMDYIRRRAEHRMTGQVEPFLVAFVEGFHFTMPIGFLQCFTAEDLELVSCGVSTVDVEDMRAHTQYEGFTASSPQVRWFWECCATMPQAGLVKLVQFTTASTKPPAGGFAALNPPLTIFRVPQSEYLPVAHTCMNRIDLPEYDCAAVLREKLTQAVTLGNVGFALV